MNAQGDDRHCEICRVPHAMMPCDRCALPSPSLPNRPREKGPPRPVEPIKLEGKYQLLDELGRGGMGTVFRAKDETLDRYVAVKFLLPEIQAVHEAVELFRREAKAMASINHRNVVRVFSFGRYGAADFIVTEFIDGPTLEETIDARYARQVHVKVTDGVAILAQAAAGLAAVHKAGVVHRDIKPGNVMVETTTGRALLMDFGIGRKLDVSQKEAPVAKRGTPAYMAPEIIRAPLVHPVDEHLVDIYAFGVTAYELMTNVLPFDGDTVHEVLDAHLTMPPLRPSSIRPDLPREIEEVILKCLEKDPAKRFASADELQEVLLRLSRRLDRDLPKITSKGRSRPRR